MMYLKTNSGKVYEVEDNGESLTITSGGKALRDVGAFIASAGGVDAIRARLITREDLDKALAAEAEKREELATRKDAETREALATIERTDATAEELLSAIRVLARAEFCSAEIDTVLASDNELTRAFGAHGDYRWHIIGREVIVVIDGIGYSTDRRREHRIADLLNGDDEKPETTGKYEYTDADREEIAAGLDLPAKRGEVKVQTVGEYIYVRFIGADGKMHGDRARTVEALVAQLAAEKVSYDRYGVADMHRALAEDYAAAIEAVKAYVA